MLASCGVIIDRGTLGAWVTVVQGIIFVICVLQAVSSRLKLSFPIVLVLAGALAFRVWGVELMRAALRRRGVRVAGIGGGPGTGTGSGRTHGPIVPCSRGPAQSWEPEDMLDVRVMVVPPGPGRRPPGRPETRM